MAKPTEEKEAPKKKEAPKANHSPHFIATIEAYLKRLASADPLFAETYKKENKNITDCCTYIVNQVRSLGGNGFADAEVFGMAIHYYDEDDIKVGSYTSGKVMVNHHVELTQEEIDEQKKKAKDKVFSDEQARLTKKPEKKKTPIVTTTTKTEETEKPTDSQASLF